VEIIETKRLKIRHVNKEDLSTLWNWRNSERFGEFCSTRRNTVDLKQFRQELTNDFRRDRHGQLIAFRKKDNRPVGTLWTYRMNQTDGHTCITTFIDSQYEKYGYGVELFAAALYSLFSIFPSLNKVYAEVYSYNLHSLSIMKKFGFVEEGAFHEHRLINNTRYSLYKLAFYRRQFITKIDFITKLVDTQITKS
jgi:RimJ/RimL family protein N-acetyltransferase